MPDLEKAIRVLGRYANNVFRYNGELVPATDVIALLEAQEPVKPILDSRAIEFYRCGQCNEPIDRCDNYCWSCGKAVKWG